MDSSFRERFPARAEELSPGEKLRVALELADLAEQMTRARLCRELPDADEDEIERRIQEWYRTRPGAEQGDAEGHPVSLPRAKR